MPIARSQSAPRVFPPATANPYDAGPGAARALLALATPPSWRGRVGGGLSARKRVARLLWLHRTALVAEAAGLWADASFWWREMRRAWEMLPAGHAGWAEVAGTEGAGLAIAADKLREAIGCELLLDTHLGFYNSLAPSLRAEWHLAQALVFARELCPPEADDLLRQETLRRIALHLAVDDGAAAIAAADDFARHQLNADFRPLTRRVRALVLAEDRDKGRFAEALAKLDWLAPADNATPEYAAFRLRLLFEAANHAARASEPGAVVAAVTRLADACPDREEYRSAAARWKERARIPWLADRGDWDAALDEANALAIATPENAGDHDRYIGLVLRRAMILLEKQADALAGAALLGPLIGRLGRLLRELPQAYSAYEGLASLYRMEAVRLVNGDRLSQALTAIAHARAYTGDDKAERDLETQIEVRLAKLCTECASIRELIRFRPAYDSGRIAADRLLANYQEDLTSGTSPRNEARKELSRMHLPECRKVSRAKRFWLRLGLAIPTLEGAWERRALLLDRLTDELSASKPANGMDLLLRWIEAVERQPESETWLREIDSFQVLRLYQGEPDGDGAGVGRPYEEIPPQPEEPCEWPLAGDEPADAPRVETKVPAIVPAANEERVPPLFWLLSWRDAGVKFLTAASLLLLIGAGWVFARDRAARRDRAAAYADLREAVRKADVRAATDAVSRFQAAPVTTLVDGRQQAVDAVARSLPDWPALDVRNIAFERLKEAVANKDEKAVASVAGEFEGVIGADTDPRRTAVRAAAQDAARWPARRERDAAYADLLAARGRKDDLGAMRASERFLQAGREEDGRRVRVRSYYDEAFTGWMLSDGPVALDADRQALAASYQKLMAGGQP